jgi:hypothetical protein
VSLDEVDAASRMEGGMILPSFGDEAIWVRVHTLTSLPSSGGAIEGTPYCAKTRHRR